MKLKFVNVNLNKLVSRIHQFITLHKIKHLQRTSVLMMK